MADDPGTWLCGEPTVTELLSDPIGKLLMCYDGITVEDISAAMQSARVRLNTRHLETDKAA